MHSATPLPLQPAVEHTPQAAKTIALGRDTSAAALGALRSETARRILSGLADGPATASELADRAETSVQNACHHLQRLQEAGLVTDAGTWYSSKGTEMTVYAVTTHRLELRLDAGE